MPEVRLIDAVALIQNHCGACANKEFCAEESCPYYEIRRRIEAAPTIEAEPIKHAHWESWGYVFHGIEWKRCSACNKCAGVSYYGLLDGKIKMETPAMCGCCGARMDGGAENG